MLKCPHLPKEPRRDASSNLHSPKHQWSDCSNYKMHGQKKYAAAEITNLPSCTENFLLWKERLWILVFKWTSGTWIWRDQRHPYWGRWRHCRNMPKSSVSILCVAWSTSAHIPAASHPNRMMSLHLLLRYVCSPKCCNREPWNSMQFSFAELLPKEWVKQPQYAHTPVSADPVHQLYQI